MILDKNMYEIYLWKADKFFRTPNKFLFITTSLKRCFFLGANLFYPNLLNCQVMVIQMILMFFLIGFDQEILLRKIYLSNLSLLEK